MLVELMPLIQGIILNNDQYRNNKWQTKGEPVSSFNILRHPLYHTVQEFV